MMKGLVFKSTGSWYAVRVESGEILECRIKGRFRIEGIKTTNPVVVGDQVEINIRPDGTPVIEKILSRKNYIIRKATNLSKEVHIIAANLDQAILVATIHHPDTSPVFIDRFLVAAEAYSIPAVILWNKTDLYDQEELVMLEALMKEYRKIGYPCICTSATEGTGVEALRVLLKDKISVLSGLSGVGKSTLINLVEPGLSLKTAPISLSHRSGKHTTTFAEMFPLTAGGYIIDTPGLRAFGLFQMEKGEISHYFPEIFKAASGCRYYNCTHTHEPGCAVLEAVVNGEISESRFCSYMNMFEESDEKYRT